MTFLAAKDRFSPNLMKFSNSKKTKCSPYKAKEIFFDFLPVSLQLDQVVCKVFFEPTVGYVPEFDCAVLGSAGNDVVVEGIPFDV